MNRPSSKRARLASLQHAYAVATQLRRTTGRDQFVVRSGDPLQPVGVLAVPPSDAGLVMALVL